MNIKAYIFYSMLLLISCTSCEEITGETDISKKQVEILAPKNGTVVYSNVVNFSWQPLDDSLTYHLQVATPDFEHASQLLVDSLLSGRTFSQELLYNKSYEWRIKASNFAYETPYTNAAFMTSNSEGFSSNTLVLVSPSDNLITNESAFTLSWKGLEGATEYRLQIIKGEVTEYDEEVKDTTVSYTFEEGNYTWKVRAQNDTTNTLYTSRKLLTDFTAPAIPVLQAPEDDTTVAVNEDIAFSWNRTDGLGSNEIDSLYVYADEGLAKLVQRKIAADKKLSLSIADTGTYYWKVKGFDMAGNESEDSDVFTFTVE